jgi:sodium-coupled monocarboxylate transporter 8/12
LDSFPLQYLEARFNRELRLFGSISFSIMTVLWLPIVIYMPALAFNQTTSVNIHVITPISMFICIVYTSMGGIKAVVWTDGWCRMSSYSTVVTLTLFCG